MSDREQRPNRAPGRRLGGVALAAIALVVGLAVAAAAVISSGESGAEAKPPNIVVVMTDDQGVASMAQGLPRTLERFSAEGTTFTDAVVTTPLCCPSRATFLTGQYGHNNGILRNDPGYPLLREKRNVLPVWLQRAGYRTAMVGKFLNGYSRDDSEDAAEPAPGWDEWRVMIRSYSYRGYRLGINDRLRSYGSARGDYLTDVLTDQAVRVVERHRGSEPLFMWLAYWAPHDQDSGQTDGRCRGLAVPARSDLDALAAARLPDPPTGSETDISDKPGWVRRKAEPNGAVREEAAESFACQVASLRAVDRGVETLAAALERAGELDETAWIFTSDNGFIHGQYGIAAGKALPYEPAIRVPLAVIAPERSLGGEAVAEVDRQVANVDLAPTILELAGADPCRSPDDCRPLDGRSLVPLIAGRDGEWPKDRAIVIEANQPCRYSGLRTSRHVYVEHPDDRPLCAGGVPELYDLERDPGQLENAAGARSGSPAAEAQEALARRLDELGDCSGSDDAGARPCD